MNAKINDFGMILDDWKQFPTHRINYYSRPNKQGSNVSCPACFATDEDCIDAALNTETGKRMKKDCKEIVIEKYDFSSGCKLYEIKTISL